MPFTISHIVAVLPLTAGRSGHILVPGALVIGSMVPDLPYFVPLPMSAEWSHSAWGPVSSDLALGSAVFALWHVALVRPLTDLAPRRLRNRLPARRILPPSTWWAVGCSVVVGAVTHVSWDTFTHRGRWGTQHVGWLTDSWGPLAAFKWFQYGSGVLGLLVLALWLLLWWRRSTPGHDVPTMADGRTRSAFWVITMGTFVATVVVTWLTGVSSTGVWFDEGVAVRIATRTIGLTMGVVLLLCLLWWGRYGRGQVPLRGE